MGTPDFAAGSLEAVIEAGHDVAAAVTGEDKPVGRGNKVQMCAVKQVAVQHNIPVLQPHRVRGNDEFLEQLKSLHPDIIIVAAYGKIIPRKYWNCRNTAALMYMRHCFPITAVRHRFSGQSSTEEKFQA